MFDSLQQGLQRAFKHITGQARLTEANMREGLDLVRRALLEADVSFPVVKQFMQQVSQRALGQQVLTSLRPTEMLMQIVYEELVKLMGPVDTSIRLGSFGKIMLCGLQGSGKTTTCAKLARLLKKAGRRPLMIAADLQRPAAIQQLIVLGQQIDVPVYADLESKDPVAVCQAGLQEARDRDADVVLIDTAGRLHIDQELMKQLQEIDRRVQPDHCFLVVDGMTGQDAVNSAKAFNEALELNGVIMTKLDGDQRGGAVLSVKAVTGVPIKFLGTGEHIQELEPFQPEGMASRILGMGDMMELVRRAQMEMDQEKLRQQEEAMRKGQFTLEEFRGLLQQTSRLGPLNKVLGLLPGMGTLKDMMGDVDAERDFRRLRGIIDSMTPEERRNPKIITQSRRRRIAAGAGVQPHEVSELIKQFDSIASIMQQLAGKGLRERMRAVQEIQQAMAVNPGAGLARAKKGTGKRLSPKERAKLRKLREKEARRRRRLQKRQKGR